MSTRLELLQVARLAPRLLGEATENVRDFLSSQRVEGGFADREGRPDLYYTVFGLDAWAAVSHEPEVPDEVRVATRSFLTGFGTGDGLDLPHLAGLIRGWSAIGWDGARDLREALRDRLLDLRRDDAGWAADGAGVRGTTYGTFLAVAAFQDLEVPVPKASEAIAFLESAALDDGGYALDAVTPVATTPTTAAAVVALRQLGARGRIHPRTAQWLRARHHHLGGFLPAPDAPMPDLLSTAVALHALSSLEAEPTELSENLLDFVDSLWSGRGGFFGHWADEELDVEYTFYGLLALGHLAVLSG